MRVLLGALVALFFVATFDALRLALKNDEKRGRISLGLAFISLLAACLVMNFITPE